MGSYIALNCTSRWSKKLSRVSIVVLLTQTNIDIRIYYQLKAWGIQTSSRIPNAKTCTQEIALRVRNLGACGSSASSVIVRLRNHRDSLDPVIELHTSTKYDMKLEHLREPSRDTRNELYGFYFIATY